VQGRGGSVLAHTFESKLGGSCKRAARWCGGVGASVVGAQGLLVCRGGAEMGGALVLRGGDERSRRAGVADVQARGRDQQRIGVAGWGRAQSARRDWCRAGVRQRWAASWCGAEGLSAVGAQGLVACTVSAKMGGALELKGWWRAGEWQRWAAS